MVHNLTCERIELPEPQSEGYELGFTDEGFGAICDGEATTGVDEFLTKGLYIDCHGSHIVVVPGDAKAFLAELRQKWAPGEFKITLGVMPQEIGFHAAAFELPRGGCYIFWSMESIYTNLGLDQGGGIPSKWIFKSTSTWSRLADILGSDELLCRSRQYLGANQGHDPSRCLPWYGLASSMVIGLLLKWSCCARSAGGFGDDDNRERASQCLQSFLRYLLSHGDFVLSFFYCTSLESF